MCCLRRALLSRPLHSSPAQCNVTGLRSPMRLVRPDQNTRQRPCPVRRHGVRAHRPALSVKKCNILDMYELIGLLEDDHLLNMVRVARGRPFAPQLTLCPRYF